MKHFYLFGIILAIAGCSPFIDTRREAGQIWPVGQSRPDRIAICYNGLFTDADELQAMADDACALLKRQAVRAPDAQFNCTFFWPSTAFFDCKVKD